MIAITQAHNEARLAGTLSFLDSGTQPARLRIYDCQRPATPSDQPAGDMLVEIALTRPSGTIANGALTLTASGPAMVLRTGTAVWARLVSGSDVTAMDMDCSDASSGTGDCKLVSTTLYSGGTAELVSAVLR